MVRAFLVSLTLSVRSPFPSYDSCTGHLGGLGGGWGGVGGVGGGWGGGVGCAGLRCPKVLKGSSGFLGRSSQNNIEGTDGSY